MRARTRRRLWLLAGAAVTSLFVGASLALATVTPDTFNGTLTSGSSVDISKTVTTPAVPPKIDIVFLADTTGSMGSAIANVQSNATSIMTTVRGDQPDSQFGAANYTDFNCTDPFPYHLDQAVTSSVSSVQTAINTWHAGNGCDVDEAQLNALYQLATDPATGWRTGSTRVVVWFGDSAGHDPSNGITLSAAIAALQGAGVTVIAIPVNSGLGNGLDSSGQATAIATATGGQVMPAATPDQVTAAITAGLTNLPTTVTAVPTCDPGLTATYDANPKTVMSGSDATFLETLTAAPDAPDGGILHCTIDFQLNGNSVGSVETVSVTVPLRPTDLMLAKSASPVFVTEGNPVTYTLTATNNGSDPDTNVVATDPLPAGETFASGDPGCTATAGTVTCDFGTLGAGASASKSYTVNVAPGAPTTLVNTASVTGDRPDSNPSNNTASSTVTVNHNPVCTKATAGPALWPPNHKLVLRSVTGVTDPDGNPVTITVTGVTQDEALNGLGDGDTGPVDAMRVAGHPDQVMLRAERSGLGDGRVYRIAYTASDGVGGSCGGTLFVGVPHDQSGPAAVDSGFVFVDF